MCIPFLPEISCKISLAGPRYLPLQGFQAFLQLEIPLDHLFLPFLPLEAQWYNLAFNSNFNKVNLEAVLRWNLNITARSLKCLLRRARRFLWTFLQLFFFLLIFLLLASVFSLWCLHLFNPLSHGQFCRPINHGVGGAVRSPPPQPILKRVSNDSFMHT